MLDDTLTASNRDLKRFRRHVFISAAGVLLSAALWSFPYYLALVHVGEVSLGRTLISLGENPVRWSSKYSRDVIDKLKIAANRQPRFVVVGSSRTHEIRGRFFNKVEASDFYNLSKPRIPGHDTDFYRLGLTRGFIPECVLFGIDVDRFILRDMDAEDMPDASEWTNRPKMSRLKKLQAHINYWRVLWTLHTKNQIYVYKTAWKDPQFWQALEVTSLRSKSKRPAYGVLALSSTAGYRSDGSHVRGRRKTLGRVKNPSRNTQAPHRTRHGVGGMLAHVFRNDVRDRADAAWEWLEQDLTYCRSKGIKVIGFRPPWSPEWLDRVYALPGFSERSAKAFALVEKIFEDHEFPFVDTLDPRQYGGSDREFHGRGHGMESVLAKMVAYLAGHPKTKSLLEPYLDRAILAQDLEALNMP